MSIDRRHFLASGGLGLPALAAMAAGPPTPARGPLAPKTPHHRAKARAVIWLFMDGGPSHLDTFDPKPALEKLHGKPLPESFPRPVTPMGVTAHTPLLASKRKFKRHGKSGLWISDWYPELARHADKLAVLRGCHADGLNHVGSVCQMNTGSILAGRPSLGAWALYGLGTPCQDLPGFVVLGDYPEGPPGGARNWGTGFMPATYQGTPFRPGDSPILDLKPKGDGQRDELDLAQALNRKHALARMDTELEARIASYELAYRMQSAAPEAVDLSKESTATRKRYGLDDKMTERMARCCLMARRLVERGVRFVQVYCGAGSKWDAHANVETNHGKLCRESDRPMAALLSDLAGRGLLDSTLVVWGGEFGRTPMSESGPGRDHNPWGFTTWMAGGGIKGGTVHGKTDQVGLYAVEGRTHVHDLHATILHQMGLDHKKLTLLYAGREERATVNGGKVVREVLG
ncbi:MAG: DUF1501 domain-containing protein [Gemmataceae bacterium]|nr:DUF1501 domain-containing protein [Gemmataceae bacterium]